MEELFAPLPPPLTGQEVLSLAFSQIILIGFEPFRTSFPGLALEGGSRTALKVLYRGRRKTFHFILRLAHKTLNRPFKAIIFISNVLNLGTLSPFQSAQMGHERELSVLTGTARISSTCAGPVPPL